MFGTFCVTAGLLPLDHNDTDTETGPEGMVLIPEGEFQCKECPRCKPFC